MALVLRTMVRAMSGSRVSAALETGGPRSIGQPPVFEFVRNKDFTGKKVILFTSLNSKFEQKYIDEFSALVRQNGGVFIKHIYVIRGRMTQQMGSEAFLDSVKTEALN